MTDLPPIEYLEQARRDLMASTDLILAHAYVLMQLAQARAELAALKPCETLEQVAWKEAARIAVEHGYTENRSAQATAAAGFLRGVQMQKEGVLPDE